MFDLMERLINRRQQGDLGEASAIEWLTRIGATVLIPFGHSPHFDLVAESDGRLVRVQVKTSTVLERTSDGHERWAIGIATNGGNQSWTGVAKRFDPSTVDYLFVLVGDGRRWMIPVAAVEGSVGLRLGGPKYSEYEIPACRPIMELIYGAQSAGSRIARARGSAGVGEPGRSVKSVATPEWVRFPPPPSFRDGGTDSPLPAFRKSERTRISPGHQITIPSTPFRVAELRPGDRLHVRAEAPGRVVVERLKETQAELPIRGSLPTDRREAPGLEQPLDGNRPEP